MLQFQKAIKDFLWLFNFDIIDFHSTFASIFHSMGCLSPVRTGLKDRLRSYPYNLIRIMPAEGR